MSELIISPEVHDVLSRGTITGQLFVLPAGQLERPLYEAVNKVLNNAGGVWSKKQKGHLFADGVNVADKLGVALTEGKIENAVDDAKAEKKELQAFYTPAALAKRVVELAKIEDGDYVLEPSCGNGSLVKAIFEAHPESKVTAVDINPDAIAEVGSLHDQVDEDSLSLYVADFMSLELKIGDFKRVVMNPPFSGNQDVKHVARALNLLAKGGILVAIMSPNTSRKGFEALTSLYDYDIEEVPAGTFKESGTNIATIILTIRK